MRLVRISIFTLGLLALAVTASTGPASAQQQEKRIALVVGNGGYAKAPLATAANDAGLIAQTLQAAGFDVIGARDLDGDTLRKSFRDFVQKAQAAGPGTVAMVYLAGYGLQLAGENYFVPVDSAIGRDTDIPIEGLRISDYVRQLAALPLKVNIVVLDAARQQPFVEGQIASGLALVEADPHMLIAYNAAPGTVAPAEPGPYGAYAQALAEMIRTGGLPLPEVFNRVRLRVNEATKGAQVPWDSQNVDAPFMFFERGPDAPAEPPPDQVASIRNKPIRDFSAQDAYGAALERDTLQGYEDFLAAYGSDPLAKRVRAIVAARREAITWRRTYRTDTPNAYWSYLRRYPRGPHAPDARRRLAILTAPLEPPPSFAMIDYDVPPPPPDEIVYVERPVFAFSDPEFGFAPPPPPPVYFLPPPPPDFVVLEPPPPPIGLFILPQPLFVPMPVYYSAPVYVAPPPNNIIYANIHNTTVINTVINRPPPIQAQPAVPLAPGGFVQPGVQPGAQPGFNGGRPPLAGGAPGPVGATAALPPAVAQRSNLIQQGKLPVPPSAAFTPAARPAAFGGPGTPGAPGGPGGPRGTPGAPQPANLAPGQAAPGQIAPGQIAPGQVVPGRAAPGLAAPNPSAPAIAPAAPQALPRANTLPVPGAQGAPPAPPAAAGVPPSGAHPGARFAPPQGGQGAPASPPAAALTAPSAPGAPPPSAAGAAPSAGHLPAPGGAASPTAHARPAVAPETGARPSVAAPPVSARPSAALPPPAAARPVGQPGLRAAPAPIARPSPPPAAARVSAPPPPRPAPAPQMARPSPPPQMARPSPPPQMARPAPPPQMARPSPPPQMARPAPPPQMARPAPPQMARPALAPPPRPAPAPAAAAAKKCPPNVPRC